MKPNSNLLIVCLAILLIATSSLGYGQSYRNSSDLKLEEIMKGYDWMGTPPGSPQWSIDGEEIYFSWNPDQEILPSEYKYIIKTGELQKVSTEERAGIINLRSTTPNHDRSILLYTKEGNLNQYDVKTSESKLLLDLDASISSPFYSVDETAIFFRSGNNLFRYVPSGGEIRKVTNFVSEEDKRGEKPKWDNEHEEWLYNDQMQIFDILKQNKLKSDLMKEERAKITNKGPRAIPTGKSRVSDIGISGDENYITYVLFNMGESGKNTEMPRYVSESGFTSSDNTRSKVGYTYGEMKLGLFDIRLDTFYLADVTSLPGIYDYLVYDEDQSIETREEPRNVYISSPAWSPDRSRAIVNVSSTDNKDRWIALINLKTGSLKCIDHQRDEAWISGPGIGQFSYSGTLGWLPDNKTVYFQSEESGYSHLYLYDIEKEKRKTLTSGEYEIYNPWLSNDKESFFFTSNEIDPGIRSFYKMSLKGTKKILLSKNTGHNEVSLSPDEKSMIVRYSYANKPWELYLSRLSFDNKFEDYKMITDSYTSAFKAYKWKEPEFILVPASDGKEIPARIYRPEEGKSNGCGVVFVHGAGYLQNAHQGWSSYFREYMFHNFLVDNGYTVLDMDYRASAGYGRYWRTAIYRHMGGKDLSDNVDGASYLVQSEGVDKNRIGIYGGSYGGFITLMAQFTTPGVFKAGVALRPVTDWAHYNHGYTANILNTPVDDPIAYRRSSPIYFADGLQDHLIMCHGMVDDNVHFQDVVRLSQRLIELQKDNWELAAYPIEAHGFSEWTSWLDEYKRIYKLFEETMIK